MTRTLATLETVRNLFLPIKQFHPHLKRCIQILIASLGMMLLLQVAKAQFSETIFHDTVSKISREGIVRGGYGEGKYIYLTGGSFSNQTPIPTVTKMDTAGNVVWTAIDPEITGLLGKQYDKDLIKGTTSNLLKDGNMIFAACRNQNLWCMSDSSGALIWNIQIPGGQILKIENFSSTELLLLTGVPGIRYHIINKGTGKIVYTRQLLSGNANYYSAAMMVDAQHNILISWGDTCYKYRDRQLDQLLWTSSLPYNSNKSITTILQDSGRYILSGLNNIRAIDTSTGSVIWYQHILVGNVPLVQSGGDGNPRKIVIRDSMVYVSWISPFVGGIDFRRGFTLTCINKSNGQVRYNVAYDFTGVPPDPPPPIVQEELDWPMDFCMDPHGNIFMTGSYDRSAGTENPGNWGIMKINGSTGDKMFEATITSDSTNRNMGSQGLFIEFKYGKIYAAGNLAKLYSQFDTKPVLLSFDSSSTYEEKFRISPYYSLRYPSALAGMEAQSNSKMALLKMVGRSGIVELRSGFNQLIWSRSFSSATKFMVPQMIRNLHDTAFAVSFVLYKEEPVTKAIVGQPDSLVFVRIDTSGNVKYRQQIPITATDSVEPIQIYTDAYNKTHFIYRRQIYDSYTSSYTPVYSGYMMDGTATGLSNLTGYSLATDEPAIRKSVASHYHADTMVTFRSVPGIRSNGHFFSTTQTPSGYQGFVLKTVRNFQTIYSCIKADSTSQFIFGMDSSGQMLAARYNFQLPNPLVWNNVRSAGSFYTGDTSATHLYAVGRLQSGNILAISRVEKSTGVLHWNFEKAAQPQTTLIPLDFRYDRVHQQITLGGYLQDSSFGQIRNSYFYFSLDSNGAVTKDVIRSGDLFGQTKIRVINCLQNGTHFYGGQLGNIQLGVVGFYNSECFGNTFIPSVTISNASKNICAGDSVSFTAIPLLGGARPQYQWKVNGVNTGSGSDTFTTTTLMENDQVSVVLTSNADCLQTNMATSNIISITINKPQYPSIQIAGTTILYPGNATLIHTTITNSGSNAVYQWQDSTQSHPWQNIAGATGPTINYTPFATGDNLKTVLKSNVQCAQDYITTSNVLKFVLDITTGVNPDPAISSGIKYYPNPVNNVLTIDSLKLAEHWQTVEIFSINGRRVQDPVIIQNQNKVFISIGHLPNGVYIVCLRRKQGVPVYLKFVKM